MVNVRTYTYWKWDGCWWVCLSGACEKLNRGKRQNLKRRAAISKQWPFRVCSRVMCCYVWTMTCDAWRFAGWSRQCGCEVVNIHTSSVQRDGWWLESVKWTICMCVFNEWSRTCAHESVRGCAICVWFAFDSRAVCIPQYERFGGGYWSGFSSSNESAPIFFSLLAASRRKGK